MRDGWSLYLLMQNTGYDTFDKVRSATPFQLAFLQAGLERESKERERMARHLKTRIPMGRRRGRRHA